MTHHPSLKFGLFGGSFDPVHRGHVALARAALRELRLDRLYVVPAARPPHKRGRTLSSAAVRLARLRAALQGIPRAVVSPWELRRRGVSYTVRTLGAFRRRFPRADWHVVLGGDSLRGFTSWRDWRGILRLARLGVGRRAGVSTPRLPPAVRRRVDFLNVRLPAVSSTELRRRAALRRRTASGAAARGRR
jgi:nicotinate-nucleotide adenylyltransferase